MKRRERWIIAQLAAMAASLQGGSLKRKGDQVEIPHQPCQQVVYKANPRQVILYGRVRQEELFEVADSVDCIVIKGYRMKHCCENCESN